jgi:hypothetical protein
MISGVPGLFEASGQGTSFTKGIVLGNHFVPFPEFAEFHGVASCTGDTQIRVSRMSCACFDDCAVAHAEYAQVGFIDAEGQGAKYTARLARASLNCSDCGCRFVCAFLNARVP